MAAGAGRQGWHAAAGYRQLPAASLPAAATTERDPFLKLFRDQRAGFPTARANGRWKYSAESSLLQCPAGWLCESTPCTMQPSMLLAMLGISPLQTGVGVIHSVWPSSMSELKGSILQALSILHAMMGIGGSITPDVVSFNTCLKACGSAGMLSSAIWVCFTPKLFRIQTNMKEDFL